MKVYLLIFIFLIVLSSLEVFGASKKQLRPFHYIVGIVFIFIAGLRYETGVDWFAYEEYFDSIPSLDTTIRNSSFEKLFISLDLGYALLNSSVKMLGGGIQIVFFIVSSLSTFLLVKNLRYYTSYVLTGLLVYYVFFFFIFDMSGLRQGLAIQIIFYSIKYVSNKNFIKYLLFILLATSIHWTAVLFIPLYFLLNKNISKMTTLIIVILSLIIFTFQIKWLEIILGGIITKINIFSLLSDKINFYTTSEVWAQERGWNLYSVYNFTRIIIILYLLNRYRVKLYEKISSYKIFYNFIILELICTFCLFEFVEISERLRYYFAISEVLIIVFIVFVYKDIVYRFFAFILLICLIFLNSYPYILESPSTIAYHPYQNYLFYKMFDIQSTGYQRLQQHRASHE